MYGIIKTDRLILRELVLSDKAELAKVLSDPESMKFYPAPFDNARVVQWINWNINNYKRYGHGLWAVMRKEGDVFLGDCGITMQDVEGDILPELGYHIKREYCNKGYATEAAKACIEYAFTKLGYEELYTYTKYDNLPSIRVAEKNGMQFVKFFEKSIQGESVKEVLYRIRNNVMPF